MLGKQSVDDVDWRLLVGISIFSGALFVFPMLLPVEVRVVVESVGDVSGFLASAWSFFTGVATFASLALAVASYRYEREDDTTESDSSSPDTAIHIDGVEGDLNLVLAEDGRIEEYESGDEDDAGTESRDRENS